MPFFSSSPRPKRSPLLRRAPRLARLRRRLPAQQNPNIARSTRLLRPIGVAGGLLLAGLVVRGWTNWRYDVAGQIERAARSQYIPQLEKQIGQKIEVGSFSTDWLGRIQVNDIVVGRNAKLPIGALIQAKSVLLTLDLVGLALGRNRFPDAITAVDFDSPAIYVRRDSAGKLNLSSLFKSAPGGEGTRWNGRVGIQNARVFFVDEKTKNRRQQNLELDARGANATVYVSSPSPKSTALDFDGRIAQTLLLGQDLGSLPLRGRAVSGDKVPTRGWLETQTPFLPATLGSEWARLPVDVRGGTVGGKFQVAFVGSEFAPRGEVQLRNIALTVPRKGLPPVAVDEVNGSLGFAGTAVQTDGVSARIAGATWTAKGRAALDEGQTIFDADVATRGLSLAAVRPLVGAQLPPQLSAGSVDVDAHASGTPQNLRAQGTVQVTNATWNEENRRARFPIVRASGVLGFNSKAPLALAARFEAPNGQLQTTIPRAQNVTLVAQSWSGSVRANGRAFDVDARADNLSATSTSLGQSEAAGVRVVASSTDATKAVWRGQVELNRATTARVRLAALFPRASLIQKSGLVSGRFNFEGLPQQLGSAQVSGALSLSEVAVSPEAIPVSARREIARTLGSSLRLENYLAARDVSADVSLRNGILNVSGGRAQTAGGLVTASLSTPIRTFAPRFTFASPSLSVPSALLFDVARAKGIELSGDWNASGAISAQGDANNVALRAVVSLRAPRFAVKSAQGQGQLSGSGADVRVVADVNGRVPRWSARLVCDSLSATSGALGSTGLVIPPDLNGARVVGAQVVAASQSDGAPWTMNLNAARAALALRGVAGQPVATIRDISALVNPRAKGVDVSRLSAKWSDSGRIDGALSLDGGNVSGEVLAREVDAQALQTLLARTSLRGARLEGRLNFKASLRPDQAPQLQAQMASGRLFLTSNGRTTSVPVRDLSAQAQAEQDVVRIQSVSAVVNDARIEGSGRAILSSGRVESNLRVADVSLAPFARLLGTANTMPVVGLASANVDVSFDPRKNSFALDGRVRLDGGAFRGVSLDKTEALLSATWNQTQKQGALKVRNLSGELEGAPFSGEIALDTSANSWSAQLAAPKVVLARFARLKARLQNASAPDSVLQRLTPPVTGTASAVVDVSGTLRDADNRFIPRAQNGLARLSVPDLKWRARTLGALDGNFRVENGRLAFAPLKLSPPENESGRAPTIALVGSVPLDARGGGVLDARLSVGEAPLDFFIETLREGRDALVATDVSSPFLDSVVAYGAKLPRGLRGRVAVEAQFGGTLANPVLKVSRLALRDGRAPLPLGGLSLPATLDAAFSFADGEVAVERAEFRLAKTEPGTGTTSAGASPPNPDGEDSNEDDDTLVQVQPDSKLSIDGNSSLVADVFNANLSQLAPWVPALRDKNGEVLLRGQLEGFSVRVEGPARDPKLTASLDAQNISFRGVTLERLRVARLDIGNGVAKIEEGNLSVKAGRFESSAASGSVAWNWASGPVADGDLRLKFPFATRDFGALVALFVPGISDARADEFSGTIQVAGTVRAPQYLGDVRVQNASFLTTTRAPAPLAIGVQRLSGELRFVNGNRLEISEDAPIKGELVAPETVAIAPAPTPVATPGAGKGKKKTKVAKTTEDNALRARGAFALRGSVELGQSDLLAVAADIPAAVASNIYKLRMDVSNARVDAPGISGVQDGVFAATFATADPTDATNTQTVRWIGAGHGTAPGKKLGAGDVFTRGAFRLRSDFLRGLPSLARSTPLPWTNNSNLSEADAAIRTPDAAFANGNAIDTRPQLVFKGFGIKASGYGSAVVNGNLVLDKAPASNRATDAARLQTISGAPSLRSMEAPSGARLFGSWNEMARTIPVRTPLTPREVQSQDEMQNSELPLRLGGNIVVSSAQIVGGGSGDGQVTRLSLLPDAPRLDVKLSLGRDVELVNSTIRARLGGDVALSGTPSTPLLLGTVRVLDGQVRFPNARARIEDGRISINVTRDAETDLPRTRLEVDATARGQAGRYAITLHLRGPLQFDARDSQNASNLRVEVTSNPALSQDEAFQQLLGILPRGSLNANGTVNVASTNQAYAQAVLQLVSAPFFSGFERSVAQALGLSSVSFEYRFNEPLAFEISKALGDRILITYRRSLGATQISDGRTPFQLRVDYRLKGDIFLGLRLDERQVQTLTLGKSWRF